MNSPAGAVFNIGGTVTPSSRTLMTTSFASALTSTKIMTPPRADALASAEETALLFGPETLSPPIAQMPDIDLVDSEDEFLFDAKHFDKSSSSTSVSNSFEIIDDDMQL